MADSKEVAAAFNEAFLRFRENRYTQEADGK